VKEFSVITPVFNRLEYTIRCIDACKRMNRDVDYEHILIDNGSFDGTLEWFKSIAGLDTDWWSQVTYIRLKENIGDHKAKALGLDYATGEHICMLDNDIEIGTEDFLDWMKSVYDRVGDCGALGAKRTGVRITVEPKFGELTFVKFDHLTYTVGPVWYVPMPFYSRNRIKFKLINGWPQQMPKGKKVYKVGEIMVHHMDDGTMVEDGHNWGDQRHKYPGYFQSKKRIDNEFGKDMLSTWQREES